MYYYKTVLILGIAIKTHQGTWIKKDSVGTIIHSNSHD